ncbi:MAG: inorganic diphosphatase [Myxococcales bacterium]|nr:inorganic diphosphatase [Myxococcales bacterium]
MEDLPRRCEVVIDSPRGSVVKRTDDGGVDFLSPLPCPFNYGSVPDTVSGDGDRIDAIVLGTRLAAGTRVEVEVLAVARFVDAGEEDPKWICGEAPLTGRARLQVNAFFRVYAIAKRALNRARGRSGATRYDGLELA